MLLDVNVWTWWIYHLTCAAHLKKYWGCLKECGSLSSKNQIPQKKLEREWFRGTQWKSLETMFKLVFNLCFSVVQDNYSNQQARLQCIYSCGKLLTYIHERYSQKNVTLKRQVFLDDKWWRKNRETHNHELSGVGGRTQRRVDGPWVFGLLQMHELEIG